MPGIPASPKNSAYSDQPNAASTPTLIRVSMVAAPCRRFVQAARWNGHAPHTTTGAARVRLSHCQLSNCSGATIASTSTGTVSAVEMISRRRSDATSGSSTGSVDPGAPARARAGRGGSGRVAVYPVASTVAIAASTPVPSGSTTCAFSVA